MDLGKPRRDESLRKRDPRIAAEEDIERRAREIAETENRDAVTEQDRERARGELSGESVAPTVAEETRTGREASRNPAEPTTDRGGQAASRHATDEQQLEELETLEGIADAEHERIVRGHREPPSRDE